MSAIVLIIGEGTLPVECAEILESRGFTIAGVCSPDDPLREWAASRNIPHFAAVGGFDSFSAATPHDYLFSIVNFRVLPEAILRRPRVFAVNYHDGPLPRYAGVYATSWAILNREQTHGVTWHVMEGKVDAGDILEQAPVRISPGETAHSLNLKCYLSASRAFKRLIANILNGAVTRTPQDLSQRTYYGLKRWPPALPETASADEQEVHARAMKFGSGPGPAPRKTEVPAP